MVVWINCIDMFKDRILFISMEFTAKFQTKMSEFDGPIEEFPLVSVDRFDKENLNSTVYLLSHCHADHMVGLDALAFAERLKYKSLKLYCHRVSVALLKSLPLYNHLYPYLVPLDTDTPVTINVANEDGSVCYLMELTLIASGHCPGSVMFLLTSLNSSVLFTGDFRFDVGQAGRLKALQNFSKDSQLQIDNVYVDTTFCKDSSEFIPKREDCLEVIFDAVKGWIEPVKDRKIVLFVNKTRYGYEFLMKALAEKFNCKIHVSAQQYSLYNCLPSIQQFMTLEADSTKIHFCKFKLGADNNLQIPCQQSLSFYPDVLKIIPTAMFFTKAESSPNHLLKAVKEKIIRCCYSTHSSTHEVVDLLSSINFKKLTPFVPPDRETSIDSVRSLLFEKLEACKPEVIQIENNKPSKIIQEGLWSKPLSFKRTGRKRRHSSEKEVMEEEKLQNDEFDKNKKHVAEAETEVEPETSIAVSTGSLI